MAYYRNRLGDDAANLTASFNVSKLVIDMIARVETAIGKARIATRASGGIFNAGAQAEQGNIDFIKSGPVTNWEARGTALIRNPDAPALETWLKLGAALERAVDEQAGFANESSFQAVINDTIGATVADVKSEVKMQGRAWWPYLVGAGIAYVAINAIFSRH